MIEHIYLPAMLQFVDCASAQFRVCPVNTFSCHTSCAKGDFLGEGFVARVPVGCTLFFFERVALVGKFFQFNSISIDVLYIENTKKYTKNKIHN